jgi:hypothetical protein
MQHNGEGSSPVPFSYADWVRDARVTAMVAAVTNLVVWTWQMRSSVEKYSVVWSDWSGWYLASYWALGIGTFVVPALYFLVARLPHPLVVPPNWRPWLWAAALFGATHVANSMWALHAGLDAQAAINWLGAAAQDSFFAVLAMTVGDVQPQEAMRGTRAFARFAVFYLCLNAAVLYVQSGLTVRQYNDAAGYARAFHREIPSLASLLFQSLRQFLESLLPLIPAIAVLRATRRDRIAA